MKICDRCENKQVTMILVNQITHEEIDLCKTCAEGFEEWMNPTTHEIEPEERKRGRPKKDGSN